jgi:glycosyltransferase involved in cell wall biosynthesis
MRIALISNSLPPEPATGGAQDYVSDLAKGLAASHDVLVISGAENSDVEGVDCVRVPALRVLYPTESRASKAIWHLRDQWMPSVHRSIVAHLRRFAPDVVHTHEPQGISAAAFTAVASAGVPHVHTAHDLNLLCVRVTMSKRGDFCGGSCVDCLVQRTIRGLLFRRHIHCLIAPSDHYRDVHVRAGIVGPDRAVTIRHGAHPGTVRVRSAASEPVSVGFIGALSPHKGILTLLQAFREAPSNWRLSVAGDGFLADRVEAEARRDPRITYFGYVEGAEKDAFFDSLDVLVIPSEWEEAATLVAVEAAVRGLPAVVSDRGGLPETPLARVFRSGDRESLLDGIRWFVDAPEQLAEASRRLVAARERFFWSNHLAKVEQVLGEVAGRNGGRGLAAARLPEDDDLLVARRPPAQPAEQEVVDGS